MSDKAPAPAELTPRQKLFIQHYLLTRNGTASAISAGYSPKGASVQGSLLLANPKIRAVIEVELAATLDRLRLDRDAVTRQLARIAFADVRRLFNPDGSIKPVHELDDDTAAMVASVEAQVVTKVRKAKKGSKAPTTEADKTLTVKYRRVDPVKALHLLGIHHQIFKDQPTQQNFVQFIIQEG